MQSTPTAQSKSRQDTLSSLAKHVSVMSARIQRLSAASQKVKVALSGEAPTGMPRAEWIARRLNEP